MMGIRNAVRRFILAATAVTLALSAGWGQTPDQSRAGSAALLAAIEGPIGPGMTRHVEKMIEAAQEQNAAVLVLRLNTPGGLASSTRDIITEILASPVPVIGYVAPSGAHAASAGTYILYATHYAAMAPGTNIGSATPVQIGGGGLPGIPSSDDDHEGNGRGEDDDGEGAKAVPDDPMTAKVVNDSVAFIRGLAELHGRNADWAEKAVREAANLPASEALELGVVNAVANDVEKLLAAADGAVVNLGGNEHTLVTADLAVVPVEPDFLTQLLSFLSNPNFAFILLMIGVYGLFFEFSNPGTIGPGVVGAICLILGLYSLNQLPVDYAGLALLLLGIGLMIAEAVTPTFGVLGVGGLIAFVVGAAFLIDTDVPAYQLSWWVIGGTAAASGLTLILLMGYLWRAYRRHGAGAINDMRGVEGQVMDWADAQGHVWAMGERWSARGVPDLRPGQSVRVNAMDGLTLVVDSAEPANDRSGDGPEDDGDEIGSQSEQQSKGD